MSAVDTAVPAPGGGNRPGPALRTSRILRRTAELLRSSRHPFLHGNVGELVFLRGALLPLLAALEIMGRSAFDVIVRVDAADGLTVVHGEEAFRTLVAVPPDDDADVDAELPAREQRLRQLRRSSPAQHDVIDQIRRCLCQDQVSVLVLLDQADIVLADPAHEPPERRRAGAMKMLLQRARKAQTGRAVYRNTCIMLAGKVSAVPDVLLAGHEEVVLAEVEKPTLEDRQLLFERELPSMPGCAHRSDDDRTVIAADLARRTDHDSLRTLQALCEFARAHEMAAKDAAALVARFRFGDRPDYWGHLRERLPRIVEELRAGILGQDVAIDLVAAALSAAALGLRFGEIGGKEGQPLVLWFLGPTGVGKTETAKLLAKLLFGDAEAYHRIDMGGYSAEHHKDRIIGAPPGFEDSRQGGQLTEPVRARPNSVVLLDEIEKAHPAVLDLLLSVFEDGRITDARGQVAYFGEAVIIVTSNIGSADLQDLLDSSPDEPTPEQVADVFRRALRRHCDAIKRKELAGRIEPGVIPFDMLRAAAIAPITEVMLGRVTLTRGPQLEVDRVSAVATVREALRHREARELGARQVRNILQQRLRRVTSWLAIHGPTDAGHVRVELWPDTTVVHVDGGAAQTID